MSNNKSEKELNAIKYQDGPNRFTDYIGWMSHYQQKMERIKYLNNIRFNLYPPSQINQRLKIHSIVFIFHVLEQNLINDIWKKIITKLLYFSYEWDANGHRFFFDDCKGRFSINTLICICEKENTKYCKKCMNIIKSPHRCIWCKLKPLEDDILSLMQ